MTSDTCQQLLFDRKLTHMDGINTKFLPIRQTWIDNFENTDQNDKRGMINLHPLIFSSYPRVDKIQECVVWQKTYREVSVLFILLFEPQMILFFISSPNNQVDWTTMMTREELHRMGPRPWPQKGTGRARHRDKRSPIWINGGWVHPPRGPDSKFYQIPLSDRINGLTGALAAKFAQNDLMIVDTISNFPFTEPDEMKQFLNDKELGPSCLIIDVSDLFPRNIALASEAVPYVNLMPAYGLNVLSMMKHESLVLTVAALLLVEQRLLHHMHRSDSQKADKKYKPPPVCEDRDPHLELPTTEYLNGDMYDLE